ncbi:MAG: hypothetical protein NT157_06550 [Candidatus Micrarchaeota archaeon]|nr:hypothetical protein [Candidatus Micrarchaeota archaeon]
MKIATLLFVIGMILIMGCGMNRPAVYNSTANETNGTGEVLIGCDAMASQELRDNCYLEEVLGGNASPAICGKIIDVGKADRCLRFAAAMNESLCGRINGTELRDDCYYYWANMNNDSAECGKITAAGAQEACYAVFNPPKVPCEDVTDALDRIICLANSTGNYLACSGYSIEGYNATTCLTQIYGSKVTCLEPSEICYFKMAATLSKEAACDGIGSKAIRTACKAVVSGTYGICGNLEFVYSRDFCYDKVAYEKSDPGTCGFIETDDYRNDCYQSLALAKADVTLCSMGAKDWDKDICYNIFARKYGNVDACYLIGGTNTRDACIMYVASALGEPSFCANMTNDYNKNYNCFLPIVTSGNYEMDVDKCGRITNVYMQWKDQCYLEIWKKTGDESMCGKIETEATRSMCG